MKYVKFEDEEYLYDIDDPTDLERAQWRMVDEDIGEMDVWVTPRTRSELATVDGVDDYKNGKKFFPPDISDKGPKHRIRVYHEGNIRIEFECWLLGDELQPVEINDNFYHLASIEDLHPKNSEYPDYYVEDGVLKCNGQTVVGDWVLEEV